ncbi:hypothetical protein GOBAR_AA01155 [Gossypium barbadense]|uniref:SWIM-type domain-containing protein n=1 Tax=Gossypium barbadense TaxID=3634 RepID=A0A2P5YUY4_GOSBA|nr:hypothetical protein GOBAR_AA01155 [Gossypium barbadense]
MKISLHMVKNIELMNHAWWLQYHTLIVDSDSDPDMDDVPNDIDNEYVNDDGNINASSVGNQIRRIVIHNNPGLHISLIDPDMAHVTEFLEYPEILLTHRLVINSDPEELFIGQRFETHELESHIFRQRMTRLENDMEGQMKTSFRQWLGTMELWQWAQSFDEGFRYGQITTNLTISCQPSISPRSYGVYLRNRRCGCRRFQTFHYPCAYVVVACAKVSLNVEQFFGDVYTLEHTLRVWKNEFSILPDLSTWEVPPLTFELVLDRGLHKNPRGRLQSSKIRNEMDIRKKSDGKHCGLCRLDVHNRSKCLQRNYHVGQSS